MIPTSLVVLSSVIAAVILSVHAMPRPVDLPDVLNRTVCPIRVEVDEDPLRIPRKIKLLRCGQDGGEWCEAHNIPKRECCDHHAHSPTHHLMKMECVEIRDKVLVRYPASGNTKTYDVAVGCTCMVSSSQPAKHLTPG